MAKFWRISSVVLLFLSFITALTHHELQALLTLAMALYAQNEALWEAQQK